MSKISNFVLFSWDCTCMIAKKLQGQHLGTSCYLSKMAIIIILQCFKVLNVPKCCVLPYLYHNWDRQIKLGELNVMVFMCYVIFQLIIVIQSRGRCTFFCVLSFSFCSEHSRRRQSGCCLFIFCIIITPYRQLPFSKIIGCCIQLLILTRFSSVWVVDFSW